MALNAFQPQGNTVLVAASSSTGVAATQISTASISGAMLTNPSTVTLYVSIGSSSVAAAMPTTAAPATGMALPAGSYKPYTIPASPTFSWISAVTSAGAAAPGLFVTPGFGQ